MIRKTVTYHGHVQGVGFRATTVHTSRGYDVTGFVRNLPDGDVELVVEGAIAEVQQFLDAVSARLCNHIRSVAVDESAATGQYARFQISH